MTKALKPTISLSASHLVKDFGNNKGVFDLSLNVASGEIVGFIGPNGAGKSTTINMLTGLIKPTGGDINIFGEAVDHTSIYHLMPRIGTMFSEQTIENEMTAETVFKHSEQLLGMDCRDQWQAMSQTLELDTGKRIKKLSLGNKKKVGVINALMHQPDLLIMDEPTSGLDPIIKSKFMNLLTKAAQNGTAILLSSHDLGEVQQICHRIVMIKSGKVILTDTTENILNDAGRIFRLINPTPALLKRIKSAYPTLHMHHENNETTLQVREPKDLINLLTSQGFYNFYIERPTLEDAFEDSYR